MDPWSQYLGMNLEGLLSGKKYLPALRHSYVGTEAPCGNSKIGLVGLSFGGNFTAPFCSITFNWRILHIP